MFEYIVETPISTYKTLSDKPSSQRGDPSEIDDRPEQFAQRSSSYTDRRDRGLLTGEKAVQRMKNLFSKTETDFHFYMVNTKEARDYTEVGLVSRDWLEANMPAISNHIGTHDSGITVIFTNNKGAAKVPMTPWIMAHRIAHAFQRGFREGRGRPINSYTEAERAIDDIVDEILKYEYNVNYIPTRSDYYRDNSGIQKYRLIKKKFFEAIGTFRSARKNMLREDFEFINELFAQYLITGENSFNPPPNKIVLSRAWGNDADAVYLRGNKNTATQKLEMLARDLGYYFENMLSEAESRIFVM